MRVKRSGAGSSPYQAARQRVRQMGLSLEARLARHGVRVPLVAWASRSKTLVKFGAVGFLGTLVDLVIYNLCIGSFGLFPATAKAISTSVAALHNFTWNHRWTFRRRTTRTRVWQKLGMFNAVSFIGLAIGVLIVKVLHMLYGDGWVRFWVVSIPYYNLYFFATIPVVTTWNFSMNHFFTWKSVELQ